MRPGGAQVNSWPRRDEVFAAGSKRGYPAAMATPRTASPRRSAPRKGGGAPSRLQEAERDLRYANALHTACLKAGAAAAINALSGKLPLVGRLAPVVLGQIAESSALPRIQHQLVGEVLDIYAIELADAERRGVVLIATAASISAQEFSRTTLNRLIRDVVGEIGSALVLKVLPMTSLVAEVAAAISSTYSAGRRTQALCRFGQNGPRDLGELLRGLNGIDESRLLAWTREALAQALSPFRRVLAGLRLGSAEPDAPAAPAESRKRRPPAKRAARAEDDKTPTPGHTRSPSGRKTPRGSRG